MSRYIDADALIETLNDYGVPYYADIDYFIERAPTIDQPSSEWIPCSERLPSKSDHKDDMVLVCYGNGSVRFNTCKNGQWCQGNPLAWMPLPEAWEGECE